MDIMILDVNKNFSYYTERLIFNFKERKIFNYNLIVNGNFCCSYEGRIKSLNRYIEELLAERNDVINISSSSGDSFSEKEEIEEQYQKLKLELDILRAEFEHLKVEMERIKLENQSLENLVKEKDQIISDAKKCYSALEQECLKIKNENTKLVREKLMLQDQVEGFSVFYNFPASSEDNENGDSEN